MEGALRSAPYGMIFSCSEVPADTEGNDAKHKALLYCSGLRFGPVLKRDAAGRGRSGKREGPRNSGYDLSWHDLYAEPMPDRRPWDLLGRRHKRGPLPRKQEPCLDSHSFPG